MIDTIATHAYTQLDDFYKARVGTLKLKNYARLDRKCRLKGAKITLPEAACLLILFQSSRVEHLKIFLQLCRPTLLRLFPTLPSYSRWITWVKKSEQLLLDYSKNHLATPGDRKTQYALDSTKINPHKSLHFPKSLKHQTGVGYTHEGAFIGFKLHALVNLKGQLVAVDVSCGNRHDLDPVKGGLLLGVKGVCFADSGYVSEQIRQNLRLGDLAFIANPPSGQIDARWLFDKLWSHPYRQRQIVEGVFAKLKKCFGLQSRSCKNAAALRARIWASVAAYLMQQTTDSFAP